MVSENPRPDRCGAKVITRVGLEIHDDVIDQSFYTDEIESVVIERDGEETRVDPEYRTMMDHLRSGFSTSAVILATSDNGEEQRIEIEDDDPYVTNEDTDLDGYCERYHMDNGRCYVHGGNNEGSFEEGNVQGMTHGLRASRSNYYNNLDDDEKALVHQIADSWIDNAPFDRDNFSKANEVMRIAVDQLRLWKAHDEFNDGIVKEQMKEIDGEMQLVEDENPANLPYDRLDRTTMSKLKDLGCLDDPDSQQAEATESLAEKFSSIDEG